MKYIRMSKGDASVPVRFWDRILVTEKELEEYEEQGYIKSSCGVWDCLFDLKSRDEIIN